MVLYVNENWSESVSSYMLECYDKRNGLSDVTIHVNNDRFYAHRIVLAHYSEFFKHLFDNISHLNHYDLFLEGFTLREIQATLLFMYTGQIIYHKHEHTHDFINVSNALNVRMMSELIRENESSGMWEKCVKKQLDLPTEHNNTSSKRKQARPQRHTENSVDSYDDELISDNEDSYSSVEEAYEDCVVDEEEDPQPEMLCAQPAEQQVPIEQQNYNNQQPFMYTRMLGMPPPPPAPFFLPPQQQQQQKQRPKDKLFWGKIIKNHHHHFNNSRAQHSAPRGGPPRAWSNQDLTEALHNVWNKKMTTSQASRIFGIPYNSLLMYVRGKYGKSLKLDLLKKGLDLALLEKQKASIEQQQQASEQPQRPGANNVVVNWIMGAQQHHKNNSGFFQKNMQ